VVDLLSRGRDQTQHEKEGHVLCVHGAFVGDVDEMFGGVLNDATTVARLILSHMNVGVVAVEQAVNGGFFPARRGWHCCS
jgi:hypothetical protein